MKTPQFKAFARDFRSFIKHNLPENSRLVSFNIYHFFVSGYIERNKKYVYFGLSDVRFSPKSWHNDILIRTAEHDKDFSGGRNQTTSLSLFKEDVGELLQ